MNILERFARNIGNRCWLVRLDDSDMSFYLFCYFYLKSLFGYSNKVRVNIILLISNNSSFGNDILLIILLLVNNIVYLQFSTTVFTKNRHEIMILHNSFWRKPFWFSYW